MKKGSSDHIKPFTLVGGWCRYSLYVFLHFSDPFTRILLIIFSCFRCVIFLQFGILSGIKALVRLHSLGILLFTIYLILYNNYCKNKVRYNLQYLSSMISSITHIIFYYEKNFSIPKMTVNFEYLK